jgi:hypothetical protein
VHPVATAVEPAQSQVPTRLVIPPKEPGA